MSTASAKLLSDASATGGWVSYPGGPSVVSVVGSFSGGTVTLEVVGPDGATPVIVSSFAANGRSPGAAGLPLAPGQYRGAITGVVTGVHMAVERVPY